METDGLLGRLNNVAIQNRTQVLIFVTLGVFTFINFVMALALFGKVNHVPSISTNHIENKAVTAAKLNPDVAGRGLAQNHNGSLEINLMDNPWAFSHLYEEHGIEWGGSFDHVSTVVGRWGFPLVLLAGNAQLTLLHCRDPICWNYTSNVFPGPYAPSATLTMGSDGEPVISAKNTQDNSLHLIKCHHHECVRHTDFVVDTNVGWESQVHIGRHGWPIVVYTDASNLYLKVARCLDHSCRLTNKTSVNYYTGGIYRMVSLLNTDERLIFAVSELPNNYLYTVKCWDHACQNVTWTQIGNWNASHLSGVISGDGRPLFSANGVFVACWHESCSNFTINNRTLPFAHHTHLSTDIAGFPVMIWSGYRTHFIRCADFACFFASVTDLSWFPSFSGAVTLGANRLPFAVNLFYNSEKNTTPLLLFKCGNPLCTKWGN
jgi:hypothetical protein